MSVQFGRWNFDGKPVDPTYLAKVSPVIAPYGPDEEGAYAIPNLSILYRAFHTTKESRRETQPHVTESGTVITWDGRLDNRAELIRCLRNLQTSSATDVSIVAAAFEEWSTNCFQKLVGDWALSIWDANSRSLILAKDPIGTRHLYFSVDNDQVTWCTILDPLVLFARKSFALCEEYIAGWLSFLPATHLTPYIGINSVPPSSFVSVREGKHVVTRYWDFDPAKKIRYRTDAEFEEHFRGVFGEAVRRRLRSDSPILAELSGGMDSSSIVSMADTIIARGAPDAPRLDTVSYYDDSEPNWDERPYFTRVEEKRGRTGTHIDVGSQNSFKFDFGGCHFEATPACGVDRPSEASRQIAACISSQGNRVVLSGVGGDEVTGGVPTPTPELQDLLTKGRFTTLAHQLKVWALNKRKPWFHLLFDAVRGFFPPALLGVPNHRRPAAWLAPTFVKRNRAVLEGYENRLKIFGSLPTFQENMRTLDALRRQIECGALPIEPLYEKRYPYLDRDLLEFMYSVPREQLVRPGQRRSLMRRALVSIVPDELLNRKRKAYVARAPLAALSKELPQLKELAQDMVCSSIGIVDSTIYLKCLEQLCSGRELSIAPILRTIAVEAWLRKQRSYWPPEERICPRRILVRGTRSVGETAEKVHALNSPTTPTATGIRPTGPNIATIAQKRRTGHAL
jgi:asparagine synthase (glutamine-hydrolysing)